MECGAHAADCGCRRWVDFTVYGNGANVSFPRAGAQNGDAKAVDRLKQNWTDDVQAFDAIFSQAMMMADALTDGIAKQFPTKVASR